MIAPPTPGRPGLRERKKRETRDRIVEAAFALFQAQGYDETSLQQIAERAGVAARTVSNYFPLKVDLLVAYRQDMLAVIEDSLRRSRGQDAFTRVRMALHDVSRENERHPNGRLLQSLLARHGSYRALERIQERFRADLLEALRDASEVRPGTDRELAVLSLSAAFLAVIQRWAAGGSASLSAQAGRLFEQWAHGVRA
jgi:AcrR family transcriptional regulator